MNSILPGNCRKSAYFSSSKLFPLSNNVSFYFNI
uniref:Uncharacterized protein n=1 Tax=Rhizophora mucronata TaxID=61149 RepID=A0A2P2P028_RHIMU